MKNNPLLRSQIDTLMREKNIQSVTDIVPFGHPLYQKIYRQLFNNKDADITFDVISEILTKFPDVSAEWLTRGEGLQTRANVVLPPPTHRQDIHLDAGATAAISQSGEAKVEATATKEEQKNDPDIAKMIRENDIYGLVSIIMNQKDEIIRLKEQRIRELEQSVRIADSNMFPPVQ